MTLRRLLLALFCGFIPTLVSAAPQRALVNLSARGTAGGSGSAALATSFTIEGSASKTMLVRALGPKLTELSVVGAIGDPTLVIYNGFGLKVAENDNWGSAANSPAIDAARAAVGATPLTDGSKDAALLVTLAPGTYTARVDGVSGATGTAMLEVYDADTVSLTPRIAYLNLTAPVASGATTTVGFVIGTGPSQTVLIRGLGPALATAGLTGTLSNPSINVLDSSSVSVASNDNWGTAATSATVANAAVTAGLRPLADGSNDAALLATLAPGGYTVQLTGVSSTAGNALVEIAIIDTDRTDFAPALLGPILPVAGSPPFGLTLSGLAIGRPSPTYQWAKNGTAVSGATNPTFSLTSTTGSDAANYSVTAANSAGSVITAPAATTLWSHVSPTAATGSFYSVAYNGTNLYIAVGDSGFISTSAAAQIWTRATIPTGTNNILRSITYGGGKFVVVGNNGTIRVSADQGVTWTAPTSGTANHLNGVLYDGTRFVAVGASSTVLTSADGNTWSAGATVTAGKTLTGVAYKSSATATYVTVASDGSIFSTTDATTGAWTAATSGTTNQFNAVAFVNNVFIAVANGGVIRSSSTGTGTWTNVTNSNTSNLTGVAYGAGLYVATGGNTLLTSSDAATWAAGAILPVGSASSNALTYAGNQFVSVGFPGVVVTSTTGLGNNWVLRSAPTTINYNDAVYGNGRFVAVGGNGSVLTSVDGGATVTSTAPIAPGLSFTSHRRVAYGAGVFVVVGDGGTISSSPDAVTWSNRSFSLNNYTALVYAAGKFVAAGSSGFYATSVDGLTWTAGTGTIGTANVNGLAYGGATPLYVAVNSSGGIFTSPDAVSWTAQTSGTTNALNNVRFAGGQFFALGASSTLLTSPDGVAWTPRGLGAAGVNLVDLAHGGGLNVAVHSTSNFNTTIFLSTDGVTWAPTGLGTNSGPPLLLFGQAGIAYGNGSFLGVTSSGIIGRTLPNTGLQSIVTQPVAATTIPAGGSTTLSVTTAVAGSTFQWYRGASGDTSSPIAGATTASYTANTSARYWVRVSGASSPPINSATAAVTGPAPTITTQPVATTITVGQGSTLSVVAATTGAGPLTYQWRKFGSPLAGANGSSLALSATTLHDAGYYDVVVSDGLSSVTSKGVRVEIVPPLASYPTVLRPRASAPRIEVTTGNISAIAVDPADANKIYVAGEFTRVGATAGTLETRLGIARFDAAGNYDSSWVPAPVTGGGSIRALLVESDGVIIGGDFTGVGGVMRNRLAKLSKIDGSLITGFPSGAAANASIWALARQVMADSSVRYLLGGAFSTFDGTTVNRLTRVTATGALDTTFAAGGTGFGSDVRALAVDGTGTAAKLYAGGLFTSHNGVTTNRNRLVRLDSTGAYDSTFNIGSGLSSDVRTIALSGTGASVKVYAGGIFTSVNSLTTTTASPSGTITLSRLVRFTDTGAIDNTFAVGTSFGSDVNTLAVDSVGNIYVGGEFTSFNGTTTDVNRLIRLTTLGARDATFNNALAGANSTVNTILLTEDTVTPANSRVLIGGFFSTWNGTARDGFARIATTATATLDATPAPTFRRPGTIYAIEPAPNGKWYVGGFFNFIDDTAINRFARLNADGTFDSGFALSGVGFNSSVNAIAVQGDGRVVAAGNFTSYAGITRNDILRLLPDGTLDTSFNPGTGFNANVNALQLLPDGRIVALGNFTTYNAVTRNRIARILTDGTLDSTFGPAAGFATNFNAPAPLALQSDGKLIVGGLFTTYNGSAANVANGLVRILDTGLIDGTYNANNTGVGFSSVDVRAVATRPNDKLVAGGFFTAYNGTARNRIAWLEATGALDTTTFTTTTGTNNGVMALHAQSDDKTILAGYFSTAGGTARNGFARLNANGTLDPTFNVPTAIINFANPINVVRPDASGNLLVATTRLDFTEFVGRGSIVVLEPAPVPAITGQPLAQTGTLGGSATFSLGSFTGETPSFQWLKNGAAILGATNATLALTNLAVSDIASYAVTLTNTYGAVTSNAVTLTAANPAPTISAQPASSTIAVGATGGPSIAASAPGTLSIQWRKFGLPIAGQTNATLGFPAPGGATLADAGIYDVLLTDALAATISATIRLDVVPATYASGPLRPKAGVAMPRIELAGANISAFTVDTVNGYIYAAGEFSSINGTPRANLARFVISTGALDTTYQPELQLSGGLIYALHLQADGKLVIGGDLVNLDGVYRGNLFRLNPNGTHDRSFNPQVGGRVFAIGKQGSKLIIGGQFTLVNNLTATRLARLHNDGNNADGTPDGALDTTFIGNANNDVRALVVQSNDAIVVGGIFSTTNGITNNRLARLLPNGSLDTNFNVVAATGLLGSGYNGDVRTLALQTVGTEERILVGGLFTTVNGATTIPDSTAGTITLSRLVRLTPAGAIDNTFATGAGFNSDVLGLAVQPTDNKIVVVGAFTTYKGVANSANRVARLDVNGAQDAAGTFAAGSGATAIFNANATAVALRGTEILVGGIFTTYNAANREGLASFDAAGAPTATLAPTSARRPGTVNAIEPLADGKWIAAGNFTFVDGTARNYIARFNADGTFDSTWLPGGATGTAFNSIVNSLATQGDGKILAAGFFTSFNDAGTAVTRNRVLRLNANGSLDQSFGTATSVVNNAVNVVRVMPDGKIALGGTFTDTGRVRLARLLADGSVDSTFVTGTGFNNTITALAPQVNGTLLVGGTFTTFNTSNSALSLARLDTNGGFDSTFNIGTGFTSGATIWSIETTLAATPANQKHVIGGTFTAFNNVTANRNRLVRLTNDGAYDPAFDLGTGFNATVTATTTQSDGKIVAAGYAQQINGEGGDRALLVRLSPNGVPADNLKAPSMVPGLVYDTKVIRPTPSGGLIVAATRVDFRDAPGVGTLFVLEPVGAAAPAISQQPLAASTNGSAPVSFVVVATGENPQYQWRKGGDDILGATNATYTIASPTAFDIQPDYDVRVSNIYGTVFSNAVALTSTAPAPVISAQPPAVVSAIAGQPTSISLTATGSGLSYVWTKFDELIPGATSATLNLGNAGLDVAGSYRGYVISGTSYVGSQPVRVTVTPAAGITGVQLRSAFNPRFETTGSLSAFASLSDGRFYAAGNFSSVEGVARPGLARFLSTGELDTSWTPVTIVGTVSSLAVQSDGKLLVGGSFVWVDGKNSFRLVRLTDTGAFDPTFSVGSGLSGGNPNVIVATGTSPNIKIYVGGAFTGLNATPANRILRLNENGSPDAAFASGTGFDATVTSLVLDASARLVVGGSFLNYNGTSAVRLVRLDTATGALDTAFNTAVGTGPDGTVSALALQGTNIVAVGSFLNYKGTATAGLVMLDTAGARVANFPLGTGFSNGTTALQVNTVAVQPDNKLVIGGAFTTYNGTTATRLLRLDGTTGVLDAAFTARLGASTNNTVSAVAVQTGAANKILVGGFFSTVNSQPHAALARLDSSGFLDNSVSANLRASGIIYSVVPVAGGKFLVGGLFSHVNDVPSGNIALVDATGALDPSFLSGTGFNNIVRALVVQGDGRIVAGGQFTTYNGSAANRIARLTATGIVEPFYLGSGFNNTVLALAQADDDELIAGGLFTSLNGAPVNRVARFSNGGEIDTAFNTAVATGGVVGGTGLDTTVNTVLSLPGGKILVGGFFANYNGAPVQPLLRFGADGLLDTTFSLGSGLASGSTTLPSISALLRQPDGRILIAGFFVSIDNVTQGGIARLLDTGALDRAFAPGWGLRGSGNTTTPVTALALQADGKVVAAGQFVQLHSNQRTAGVVRLLPTGGFDSTFGVPFATGAASSAINVLTFLADGALVMGSSRQDYLDRSTSGLTVFENASLPRILQPPFGGAFQAGTDTGTLTVNAVGVAPFRYEWRLNGNVVANTIGSLTGANTDTLTFQNFQAVNTGNYTVTVTDATNASVTSAPLPISVIAAAPAVTTPVSLALGNVAQAGTVGAIRFNATGSAPLTTQWQKDAANLSGGTANAGDFELYRATGWKPSDAGIYGATVTNTFPGALPAVTTTARAFVSEESGWTWHNPTPTANALTILEIINGQFFIGGLRGTRLTSTNGTAWNVLPALGQNNLVGYTFGNGRHLLLGSSGFTALSTDGVNWQTGTIGNAEPTQDVAFGYGLFMVTTAGSGSPTRTAGIHTSPDGVTWTQRYSTTAASITSMVHGSGITLANANGGKLLRSTNGTDWTLSDSPARSIASVAFTNGRFFVLGDEGELFVSTDALTWSRRDTGSGSALRNIVLGTVNGAPGYVMVGSAGVILTTNDLDANNWTTRTSGTADTFRPLAFHNGTWVLTNNQTVPLAIYTSTDAITWTNRVTGQALGQTLVRLASQGSGAASSLVAVANNGQILRTTNGSTWSDIASGTTNRLLGVTATPTGYLVVGGNTGVATMLNSSDGGLTFAPVTNPAAQILRSVVRSGSTFVAVGDFGTLLTSADGTTWTAATSGTGVALLGIATNGSLYVAVGNNGTILTSSNLTTWTPAASGVTANLTRVAFGNGRWLAAGTLGTLLTSTDAATWTPVNLNANDSYQSVVFDGTRFFVSGGSNTVYATTNGTDWSGSHLGFSSSLNDVLPFGGRLYGVGGVGTILSAPLVPSIHQSPIPQAFVVAAPVTLRVGVDGSALPVTYQWRKGTTPIVGATSATYTIPSPVATDVGNYDVIVTTSAGSVTSAPATLSLAVAPAIVTQPTAAIVRAGGTLTLQVTASGSFPLTYQWRKGTTPIDGATAPFYSKHGFTADDVGNYDVIVTNIAGSVTSAAAAVTLAPAIGTLASDPAFTRPDFKQDAMAGRVTVDPLGRVYATWTNANFISGVGNQLRGAVIRFNADGTVDNTFNLGAALVDAWPVVLQPDGKILVGGVASNESSETGFELPRVFRFNPDGTRDFSYYSPHFAAIPRFMRMQPDGRLLVVVSSTLTANGGIPIMARLNADGSLDSTFAQPTLSANGSIFLPPVVDGSGNIYVGGIFTTINGVARPAVARLLANGAVDTGFVPAGFTVGGGTQVRGLALQTQGANAGKLLVAGGPLNVSGVNRPAIRLLSTGALDPSFTLVSQADAGMSIRPRLLNTLGDDRFYVVGATVARFLADGAIDTSYTKPAFSAEFFWMDTMADGRVVVPPDLGSTINGVVASSLVRFTATGAVDPTFAPGAVNREIYPGRFAVLSDSKLLTWGQFDRANNTARPGIARFNANGTLDSAFTVTGVPNLRYVAFAEVGSDGRILAGTRTGTNPTALTSGVVRLQPDGAVDSSFTLDASLAGSTNGMEFRLLPDNKVSVWSLSAQGLVSDNNFFQRLTAGGALDPSFNPTGFGTFGSVYRAGGATGAITSITLGSFRVLAHDSLGRQYARGTTGSYPANATSLGFTLYRVAPDGALDPTFTAPVVNWATSVSFPTVTDAQTNGGAAGQVNAVVVSGTPFAGAVPVSGNKLLVYGLFTTLGGQPAPGLARLTNTGAVDPTFNIGTGAQLRYQANRTAQVEGVTVAADGKIWVTGAFDTFSGVQASGIVRLNPDGTIDPNFATDIFYRTYLGGLTQVGFAPNGTVYVSGTFSRGGDTFPSAFQALVNSATPVISTQPVATQNLFIGATANFSVTATGTSLTYQWRKNGTDISGATAATYAINPVAVTDAGRYDVVIANGAGSVASAGAVLNVASTVAVVDQPVARRVAAGATVQLAVSATSTVSGATLTYQWRKDAGAIAGATASTLTLSRVSAADAAAYTVVVGDGSNSVTSQPAALTVTPPDPVLWQQFTEFSIEQAPARTVHDGAGKVYLPWSVQDRAPNMANGKFVGALARFDEATGALDPAFRLDPRYRRASHVVVQPDGKLLVAVSAGDSDTVIRVTATGALDTATPFTAPLFARSIRFITRQADGKVIVTAVDNLNPNAPASALGATAPNVYRLNADGGLDSGFTPATITANTNIFGPPVVDSAGLIYLAGSFNTINGTSRLGVARLTATGALDATFPTGLPAGFTYNQIRAVALQSGDRPVFVGDFFSTPRGTAGDRVMAFRFTAAGAFDSSFAQPLRSELGLVNGPRLRHLVVLPDDSILAVSDRVVRLTANGARDTTFSSRALGKECFWLSRAADGRLFLPDQTNIYGQGAALSTVSNGIAVTSANGVPDASFQTGGWGRSAVVDNGVVLGDGRVWVGGAFNRYGGTPAPGLALFAADGTLAPAQVVSSRSMTFGGVADAGSNKVYVLSGTSSNSSEPSSVSLVRLGSDGAVDSGFNPVLPAGYSLGSASLAAGGGKLLLAQESILPQDALGGSTGNSLLRFNADGTRDTGFNAALASFAAVDRNVTTNAVTLIRTGGIGVGQVLPDGRVLVGSAGLDGAVRLIRLLDTGAIDTTFSPPSFGTITPTSGFTSNLTDPVTNTTAQFAVATYSAGELFGAVLQIPDGRVYLGGRLAPAGAPRGLVRLNANGSIDSSFTGAGLGWSKSDSSPYVSALAVDAVGRVYVAGRFDSYNGTAIPTGLFRLNANGSLDTAWTSPISVLDAPRAFVRLSLVGSKLYAFGTVAASGDTLPAPYRVAPISGAPVFSPPSASNGTVVAISGFGFTGATSVRFNGLDAGFTVSTDNQILATVPSLATSGVITIVTPTGTQTTAASFNIVAGSRLQNLSRLGAVGTGENAVLVNFTVEGSAAKTILLRAAGPALATFGISGTLADPVLTLHDATGAEIARNDDWGGGSTLSSAFASAGAFSFATSSKDAALRLALAPGTYTARVTGAGGTTGVALVEVYDTGDLQRLAYLASRAAVTPGGPSTSGFVIGGPTNAGAKTVLLRARGTSLVPALGALANPKLALFGSTGSQILANDDWVNFPELADATAAVGGAPLAPSDSALLLNLPPGSYTVQVDGNGGSGFALTEIFLVDAFRDASFAPALLAPLQNQTVATGAPVYLNAPVVGKPAVTYQWKKNGADVTGTPVAGSPGAFFLPAAAANDTGVYTVVMSNSAGATTSAPVTLAVNPPAGYAATQALIGPGYLAGGTITVTNTFTYVTPSASLGWSVTLPAGWSFVSDGGSAGETKPAPGATGNIAWAWTTVPPAGSLTFTYTLNVPAGESATRALTALAVARPGGNPVVFVANPNPLALARVAAHSADTNQDFRIGLIELTRVIELFNTRNGTVRTGRYSVATAASEDGFNPDFVTVDSATVTLTAYHSADTARGGTRDGKIDLVELTRVIELYNTRIGTVRTGAYRPAAGTEDGYEPVP